MRWQGRRGSPPERHLPDRHDPPEEQPHLPHPRRRHAEGGSQDDADYPDTTPKTNNSQLENCRKTLVYAESAENLHITGAGTIDGDGAAKKWQGSSKEIVEAKRPMAIFIVLSNHGEHRERHREERGDVGRRQHGDGQPRHPQRDRRLHARRDERRPSTSSTAITSSSRAPPSPRKTTRSASMSGVLRGVDDVVVRKNHVLTSGVANALSSGPRATARSRTSRSRTSTCSTPTRRRWRSSRSTARSSRT